MILKEKVILVTGGNGLLGKAYIEDIKSKGGIAINLDINIETDISSNKVHLDITTDESITKAIKAIIDYHGRIDGLEN